MTVKIKYLVITNVLIIILMLISLVTVINKKFDVIEYYKSTDSVMILNYSDNNALIIKDEVATVLNMTYDTREIILDYYSKPYATFKYYKYGLESWDVKSFGMTEVKQYKKISYSEFKEELGY